MELLPPLSITTNTVLYDPDLTALRRNDVSPLLFEQLTDAPSFKSLFTQL